MFGAALVSLDMTLPRHTVKKQTCCMATMEDLLLYHDALAYFHVYDFFPQSTLNMYLSIEKLSALCSKVILSADELHVDDDGDVLCLDIVGRNEAVKVFHYDRIYPMTLQRAQKLYMYLLLKYSSVSDDVGELITSYLLVPSMAKQVYRVFPGATTFYKEYELIKVLMCRFCLRNVSAAHILTKDGPLYAMIRDVYGGFLFPLDMFHICGKCFDMLCRDLRKKRRRVDYELIREKKKLIIRAGRQRRQ